MIICLDLSVLFNEILQKSFAVSIRFWYEVWLYAIYKTWLRAENTKMNQRRF